MFSFFWMDPVALDADADPALKLPSIEIIEAAPDDPAQSALTKERLRTPSGGDLADLLRSINGVNAGRMGGHGLEPVIRGQSQTQLNVRFDGMEVHGACPNRMDPPTAFAQPAAIDRVTIEKGVQTLRHGPSGSGGALLIERRLPMSGDPSRYRFSASAADNGAQGLAAADLGGAGDTVSWRVLAAAEERDNYEDGDGNEVRSAFDRQSVNLMLGANVGDTQHLELGVDRSETSDTLYAGAGMDAPEESLAAVRLRYQAEFAAFNVAADAWRAEVDHVMDNYSLRPLASGAMAMRVPSEANTQGFNVALNQQGMAGIDWTLGAQFATVFRDATRYAGPNPNQVTMANAFMWPDVRLDRQGVFVEGVLEPDLEQKWVVGLRYDRFDGDAARASQRVSTMVPAPQQFYNQYYGSTKVSDQQSGIGALLRFEHAAGSAGRWFAGVSRSVRAPDSTERYMAAMAAMPSGRWIGNPNLKLEVHQQVDAGYAWRDDGREASVTLYADRIDDYILRDRARRQSGVLLAEGATVYRNVDARLLGIELAYAARLGERWRLDTQLAYVRGDNLSDDRVLAQMPPLDGRLALVRESNVGEWTALFRGAARQNRADTSVQTGSGLDAQKTPGYGVFDLAWRRAFGAQVVEVRLDNVFDRTYAVHLNRANVDPFNPDPIQVNEAGRTLRVGWEMQF